MTTTQVSREGVLSPNYAAFIDELKETIRTSQVKAVLNVNAALVQLYWEIGTRILRKQKEEGWGTQVVEKVAKDLKSAFPHMSGFSRRNLFYMKQFAEAYPEFSIVQHTAAQIPWGHNMVLLDRIESLDERIWYAKKTIENGWSRNMLELWIESELYSRQGKAITNFATTLPQSDSDFMQEMVKDPYNFDFIRVRDRAAEAELEEGLVEHMQQVLIELGAGFAFVGRQYRIEVEEEEFLIDLLFYHFKLRRFVVVELKNGAFKPEYAGKMGFYLAAVDAQLKHPMDEPSIGMILCKTKKQVVVEYTLQESRRPIGVSNYVTKLLETLPEDLKSSLPTVEQLESELSKGKKKRRDETAMCSHLSGVS